MTSPPPEQARRWTLSIVILKLAVTIAAFFFWPVVVGALYDFGTAGLGPAYEFGWNQALSLLGTSAASVVIAGIPFGKTEWLVPGFLLAIVTIISGLTAYVTILDIESVGLGPSDGSAAPGNWAAHYLGVLTMVIPVVVFSATAVVRICKMKHRTGLAVIASASLLVPAAACVSLLFGV